MNAMVGNHSFAGTSFSTWTFLNCCAADASFGFSGVAGAWVDGAVYAPLSRTLRKKVSTTWAMDFMTDPPCSTCENDPEV
jgi:hypothetical protein